MHFEKKRNKGKTDIQEREQKMRMSKKQTRINTKKENIFWSKA